MPTGRHGLYSSRPLAMSGPSGSTRRIRSEFCSEATVASMFPMMGENLSSFYNLPLGEIYALGVDMEEPYNVYAGLQDHDSWKGPSNSWSGQVNLSDWITVGGGDGMYNVVDPADSRWVYNCREFGSFFRLDQKTGTRQRIQPVRDRDKEPYRFNWTPPIHVSPHNGSIVYIEPRFFCGSLNRVRTGRVSPDLNHQ